MRKVNEVPRELLETKVKRYQCIPQLFSMYRTLSVWPAYCCTVFYFIYLFIYYILTGTSRASWLSRYSWINGSACKSLYKVQKISWPLISIYLHNSVYLFVYLLVICQFLYNLIYMLSKEKSINSQTNKQQKRFH